MEGSAGCAAMAKAWPFFATLLENAELSLAKADPAIADLYLARSDRADLVAAIRDELARTTELVLAVSGHANLLDGKPDLQRAIEYRNPYVDALSFLQVRFLRRAGHGTDRTARPGNHQRRGRRPAEHRLSPNRCVARSPEWPISLGSARWHRSLPLAPSGKVTGTRHATQPNERHAGDGYVAPTDRSQAGKGEPDLRFQNLKVSARAIALALTLGVVGVLLTALPASASTITSFTPTCGVAGTVVTINGAGFTGMTDVLFNGTSSLGRHSSRTPR